MATVNLIPNADVSCDWTLASGSDTFEMVNEDNTGNAASDGSRVYTTTAGDQFYVALTDFTESYSSIDSVQVVTRTAVNTRGSTHVMRTFLTDSAGVPNQYYDESSSAIAGSTGYQTTTFTERTTYDGSHPWTNVRLDGLRVVVEVDALSIGTCHCTFVYVIVTYTPPLATDNAIFFGCNF